MRIKPLTGQVLVSLIPGPEILNGIHLPDKRNPEEPVFARKAIVREIGPWPKTKNGMGVIPPFGRGATVLVNEYKGQKLTNFSEQLRLISTDDIVALLSNDC